MSKTKQKDRPRYPCGKLKPEVAPPAVVRRILDRAVRGANNPLLGSRLGRLRLTNVLSNEQAIAGTHFATLVGAYDRIKGMPRRSVASPSYEIGFGRSSDATIEDEAILEALAANGGDLEQAATVNKKAWRIYVITERYGKAQRALAEAGPSAEKAVMTVAIYDEFLVSGQHEALRAGLDALGAHFRLTNRKR